MLDTYEVALSRALGADCDSVLLGVDDILVI